MKQQSFCNIAYKWKYHIKRCPKLCIKFLTHKCVCVCEMFLPDCFQSQVDQTNEPLTEGAIKSLLALNKQRLVELEDIRNVLKPIVSKQKSKEAPPKEGAKKVSKAPKKKGK